MELRYIKGDLFKVAPKGAYLLHACNCKGSWGAGIAAQFKLLYPIEYETYKDCCLLVDPGNILITNKIICLFTSKYYGAKLSSTTEVLLNTKKSLAVLKHNLETNALIYSPKINAGLFATPWEDTEKLINQFLAERPDVTWVVVEYDP